MSALVALLAVVVGVLTLLVIGLLRSHALILRKLHELGAGIGDPATGESGGGFEVAPGRPKPTTAATGRAAADVAGTDVHGDPVALRVRGVEHPTVLAFLSSSCLTCAGFWEAFRRPERLRLPEGARLVVVTKDAAEESPTAIADLAPPRIPVVLSSTAWADYDVPGSPYVVAVDGQSGSVIGEGTGGSWEQVANLLAQASGDLAWTGARRRRKPAADLERESDIDAALLAAGLLPGDERLYTPLQGDDDTGDRPS